MVNSRTIALVAILSAANLLLGTSLATPAESQRHRQHAPPKIIVTAPYQGGAGEITYRLNPYASYRWFGPGWSVGLGDWGATPVHYPYGGVWHHAGDPSDLACNMPSSPCWDQDRE